MPEIARCLTCATRMVETGKRLAQMPRKNVQRTAFTELEWWCSEHGAFVVRMSLTEHPPGTTDVRR